MNDGAICQNRPTSKRCNVPPTKISTLMGWYINGRVLRMCNRRTARSAGSTDPTENKFHSSMFRERKVTSWATPDGCRDAVLPLLAWCIPHAEYNMNESLSVDCAMLRFCKSPSYSDLLTRTMRQSCRDTQMTDGDLPKPSEAQTLLCTFYRSLYPCGMIHEREHCAWATVELCRLHSAYRVHILQFDV